jgi:hypothetical protein
MAVTFKRESPQVITLRVSGRVGSGEWQTALSNVAKLLNPREQTSLLVLAENFAGWGQGDWSDLSFRQEYDARVNRMAIVADERWRDPLLMFAGKGLRRIDVEFFTPAEVDKARRWLTSAAGAAVDKTRDETGAEHP